MKTGDVVICVNNEGQERYLSLGKKYVVLSQISGLEGIKIVNDFGEEGVYFTSRFELERTSEIGTCFFLKGGGNGG